MYDLQMVVGYVKEHWMGGSGNLIARIRVGSANHVRKGVRLSCYLHVLYMYLIPRTLYMHMLYVLYCREYIDIDQHQWAPVTLHFFQWHADLELCCVSFSVLWFLYCLVRISSCWHGNNIVCLCMLIDSVLCVQFFFLLPSAAGTKDPVVSI